MEDTKLTIHSVYDNGGETLDRYTIYFDGPGTTFHKYSQDITFRNCIASSVDPQGFFQHTDGVPGPHNGEKIDFSDLPEIVQKAVLRDMEGV